MWRFDMHQVCDEHSFEVALFTAAWREPHAHHGQVRKLRNPVGVLDTTSRAAIEVL